ncbi:MAG: phosphoglycerate kinase [Candidatus Omnitrophota bacterium]
MSKLTQKFFTIIICLAFIGQSTNLGYLPSPNSSNTHTLRGMASQFEILQELEEEMANVMPKFYTAENTGPYMPYYQLDRSFLQGKVGFARLGCDTPMDKKKQKEMKDLVKEKKDMSLLLTDVSRIADPARIDSAIETLIHVIRNGGRVVLQPGWIGRPEGKIKAELSVVPVFLYIRDKLVKAGVIKEDEMILCPTDLEKRECKSNFQNVGVIREAIKTHLKDFRKDGESDKDYNKRKGKVKILCLENPRFDKEYDSFKYKDFKDSKIEEPAFIKMLKEEIAYVVYDDFNHQHRPPADISLLPEYVPSFVGKRLAEEIRMADILLEILNKRDRKPFALYLGGKKIETKPGKISKVTVALELIRNDMMRKDDRLLIGGGVAYAFLVAQKYIDRIITGFVDDPDKIISQEAVKKITRGEISDVIGDSYISDDPFDTEEGLKQAHERIYTFAQLLVEAAKRGIKVGLPIDHKVRNNKTGQIKECTGNIERGWYGIDIGSKTREMYNGARKGISAGLIAGPMGIADDPDLPEGTEGTDIVLNGLAEETRDNGAYTLSGGGETTFRAMEIKVLLSWLSLGGGALLEYIQKNRELHGLLALKRSAEKFAEGRVLAVSDAKSVEDTIQQIRPLYESLNKIRIAMPSNKIQYKIWALINYFRKKIATLTGAPWKIPITAGNWKENIGEEEDAKKLIKEMIYDLRFIEGVIPFICPTAAHLKIAAEAIKEMEDKGIIAKGKFTLGAQDVSAYGDKEMSPYYKDIREQSGRTHIKTIINAGKGYVKFIIVGHSETCRTPVGVGDEEGGAVPAGPAYDPLCDYDVNNKAKLTLKYGLTPDICIGESYAERNAEKLYPTADARKAFLLRRGITDDTGEPAWKQILRRQIQRRFLGPDPDGAITTKITKEDILQKGIYLSYEPIHFISFGNVNAVVDMKIVEEANRFITSEILKLYDNDKDIKDKIQTEVIKYGGSANETNGEEIISTIFTIGTIAGGASRTSARYLGLNVAFGGWMIPQNAILEIEAELKQLRKALKSTPADSKDASLALEGQINLLKELKQIVLEIMKKQGIAIPAPRIPTEQEMAIYLQLKKVKAVTDAQAQYAGAYIPIIDMVRQFYKKAEKTVIDKKKGIEALAKYKSVSYKDVDSIEDDSVVIFCNPEKDMFTARLWSFASYKNDYYKDYKDYTIYIIGHADEFEAAIAAEEAKKQAKEDAKKTETDTTKTNNYNATESGHVDNMPDLTGFGRNVQMPYTPSEAEMNLYIAAVKVQNVTNVKGVQVKRGDAFAEVYSDEATRLEGEAKSFVKKQDLKKYKRISYKNRKEIPDGSLVLLPAKDAGRDGYRVTIWSAKKYNKGVYSGELYKYFTSSTAYIIGHRDDFEVLITESPKKYAELLTMQSGWGDKWTEYYHIVAIDKAIEDYTKELNTRERDLLTPEGIYEEYCKVLDGADSAELYKMAWEFALRKDFKSLSTISDIKQVAPGDIIIITDTNPKQKSVINVIVYDPQEHDLIVSAAISDFKKAEVRYIGNKNMFEDKISVTAKDVLKVYLEFNKSVTNNDKFFKTHGIRSTIVEKFVRSGNFKKLPVVKNQDYLHSGSLFIAAKTQWDKQLSGDVRLIFVSAGKRHAIEYGDWWSADGSKISEYELRCIGPIALIKNELGEKAVSKLKDEIGYIKVELKRREKLKKEMTGKKTTVSSEKSLTWQIPKITPKDIQTVYDEYVKKYDRWYPWSIDPKRPDNIPGYGLFLEEKDIRPLINPKGIWALRKVIDKIAEEAKIEGKKIDLTTHPDDRLYHNKLVEICRWTRVDLGNALDMMLKEPNRLGYVLTSKEDAISNCLYISSLTAYESLDSEQQKRYRDGLGGWRNKTLHQLADERIATGEEIASMDLTQFKKYKFRQILVQTEDKKTKEKTQGPNYDVTELAKGKVDEFTPGEGAIPGVMVGANNALQTALDIINTPSSTTDEKQIEEYAKSLDKAEESLDKAINATNLKDDFSGFKAIAAEGTGLPTGTIDEAKEQWQYSTNILHAVKGISAATRIRGLEDANQDIIKPFTMFIDKTAPYQKQLEWAKELGVFDVAKEKFGCQTIEFDPAKDKIDELLKQANVSKDMAMFISQPKYKEKLERAEIKSIIIDKFEQGMFIDFMTLAGFSKVMLYLAKYGENQEYKDIKSNLWNLAQLLYRSLTGESAVLEKDSITSFAINLPLPEPKALLPDEKLRELIKISAETAGKA